MEQDRVRELASSLLIGLAAGLFGGLVGLGGGVVMIPLMVRVAGLRQQQAHGTSLVALVFTGFAGAVTYATRGAVDLAAAAALAIPAVATARIGARWAHALPEWQLKRAFGAFLVFVTALLVAKPFLVGLSVPATGAGKIAVLLAAGGFTGLLSGMMGVGGGSLMVPAMVLLAGFPQVLAQGSSLLAMVPAGAAGAHKHAQLGNVVKRLLPGLVPGILVGTWIGATVALRLEEEALRAAFAVVVAWSGLKFLRAPRPVPVAAAPGAPAA
jgi:uncharacterized membrane protein YfcA